MTGLTHVFQTMQNDREGILIERQPTNLWILFWVLGVTSILMASLWVASLGLVDGPFSLAMVTLAFGFTSLGIMCAAIAVPLALGRFAHHSLTVVDGSLHRSSRYMWVKTERDYARRTGEDVFAIRAISGDSWHVVVGPRAAIIDPTVHDSIVVYAKFTQYEATRLADLIKELWPAAAEA